MNAAVFRRAIAPGHIRENVPLREYTTMHVGGPADVMIFPADESEIAQALDAAKREDIPVCVMGNGSNLLFSDEGFRGAVVRLGSAFAGISREGCVLRAQAGALLSALSKTAAENSLTGLEFASGIPGSVGGAVCMNAGAYGGEISQTLTGATVFTEGHIERWDREQMHFAYRHSAVMERDCVVLSAAFSLREGDSGEILARMRDLNARRREKQPLQYPSCGSFFKRPEGYYAGALIEQAGLKGFSIGDAQVSELHAGFVINRGNATANQIYALMRHVQSEVYRVHGVHLEPEVKLIGHFEA